MMEVLRVLLELLAVVARIVVDVVEAVYARSGMLSVLISKGCSFIAIYVAPPYTSPRSPLCEECLDVGVGSQQRLFEEHV
jgi:hypothetical protein|eukprot:evm.model.NODE_40385_length_66094_cov_35.488079.15